MYPHFTFTNVVETSGDYDVEFLFESDEFILYYKHLLAIGQRKRMSKLSCVPFGFVASTAGLSHLRLIFTELMRLDNLQEGVYKYNRRALKGAASLHNPWMEYLHDTFLC